MEKSDPKRAPSPQGQGRPSSGPAAGGSNRPASGPSNVAPAAAPSPSPPSGKPAGAAPATSNSAANGAGNGATGDAARPWLVRKRTSSEVLRCPDLPTLRTWMMERRISRDDEISRGGKVYRRLSSVVEFESLFHSVDVERAERRRATGQMPVVAAQPPSAPAATAQRADSPTPSKVQVTPPGMTQAANNMSPLRLTPSGQAQKPRAPQTAPSMPAAGTTPPRKETSVPPTTARKDTTPPPSSGPRKEASLPPTPAPRKETSAPPPTPPGPSTPAAAPAVTAAPAANNPPPAPPSTPPPATAAKPAAGAKPATPSGSKPAPVAAKPTPPPASPIRAATDDDGDESGTQPTKRFTRLEAPNVEVTELTPVEDSGNETVPFIRQPAAEIKEVRAAAPLPPQRIESPAPPLPDPIEQALRQSDPVPRHLKEAADPDRTGRMAATVDSTERYEKTDGRRGIVLLAVSFLIAGGLVLALQYANKTDDNKPPETPPTTTPDKPETPGTTNPPTTPDKPETPPEKPEKPENLNPPTTVTTPPKPPTNPPATVTTPPATVTTPPTTVTTPPKPATNPPATATNPPATNPPATVTTPPKPPTNPPATVTTPPKPPVTTPPATATNPPKPPITTPTPTTPTPPKPATPPNATGGDKKVVVTEVPKTFDAQMELAQKLVEREQFGEAQRLFETILGYAAHVPAVHVGLGKCSLEQGRSNEAIEHYKNALTRLSTYGPAIFGLAKAYRQKGDKEQAINWYKKYLEVNPNGGAAQVARESIAKLEGTAPTTPTPPSELVKPPAQPRDSSELVKPQ